MALSIGLLAMGSAIDGAQEVVSDSEYEYRDEGVVVDTIVEILSRPEFERLREGPKPDRLHEEKGWLARFADWLAAWLGREREGGEGFPAFALAGVDLLVYAAAALGVGIVIVIIVRAASTSPTRRVASATPTSPVFRSGAAPGEIVPEQYWRRAISHGDAGRYREAIRELLLGAMSAIERRELIVFRRGLTNRDYCLAVHGPARESFAVIAQAFEIVYFGRRKPSLDGYRECCREFAKSFHTETTT